MHWVGYLMAFRWRQIYPGGIFPRGFLSAGVHVVVNVEPGSTWPRTSWRHEPWPMTVVVSSLKPGSG